jgi:hypothetical protein
MLSRVLLLLLAALVCAASVQAIAQHKRPIGSVDEASLLQLSAETEDSATSAASADNNIRG